MDSKIYTPLTVYASSRQKSNRGENSFRDFVKLQVTENAAKLMSKKRSNKSEERRRAQ